MHSGALGLALHVDLKDELAYRLVGPLLVAVPLKISGASLQMICTLRDKQRVKDLAMQVPA